MENYTYFSHDFVRFFVLSASLLAYLDPGSGSFILQLILASIVGSLFIFKNFWRRLISFIRGIFSKDSVNKEE